MRIRNVFAYPLLQIAKHPDEANNDKIRVLMQIQRSLFLRYGWLCAWWQGRPVDASGAPVSWITYPAIDFLSQFDFSDASIYEWGSGFSTIVGFIQGQRLSKSEL
jgi:hypothetical protein